jgi:hypothetical protein
MPDQPIRLRTPEGGEITVQAVSVPLYLELGASLLDAVPDDAVVAASAAALASGAPARSALKEDWVEHAVRAGMARDEAESSTKDELVERFADQPGNTGAEEE